MLEQPGRSQAARRISGVGAKIPTQAIRAEVDGFVGDGVGTGNVVGAATVERGR